MDSNEDNQFEAITLSNVWLKTYILDVIGKINENEIIAYNGSTSLVDLLQLNDEQILRMQLKAFELMKTYLKQLLDNAASSIDRKVVLKITLILKNINNDSENYILRVIDDIRHLETCYLTGEFNDALNCLSLAKGELLIELADKEILMPKKSSGRNEKIGELEDG